MRCLSLYLAMACAVIPGAASACRFHDGPARYSALAMMMDGDAPADAGWDRVPAPIRATPAPTEPQVAPTAPAATPAVQPRAVS